MRVLIIEADPEFGPFVKGLVEGWGHTAVLCNCGSKALQKMLSRVFDLVLLEALLPDEKADRLILKLKGIDQDALIVVMTDQNSHEMEVRIRELGILYYLIKSLEIENLKPLLDHIALRQRKLEKTAKRFAHDLQKTVNFRMNYLREREILKMNTNPREIISSDQEIENKSICSTCEHFSRCMLRQKNKKPVFFCEEYQPAGFKRDSFNGDGKRAWGGAVRTGSCYLGLCRTCRKLPSCSIAKPGGGTWHCADYEKGE